MLSSSRPRLQPSPPNLVGGAGARENADFVQHAGELERASKSERAAPFEPTCAQGFTLVSEGAEARRERGDGRQLAIYV
jgi:hypothetical protein